MKYPHIIFLDFDGPLFSERALLLPENNGHSSEILRELNLNPLVSYFKMDSSAIAMLEYLYSIRTYQIVITSSWVENNKHSKEQIQRLLNINDISIKLHDNWKINKEGKEKVVAIKNWLDENKQSDYLILDDFESCEGLNNERVLIKNNIQRKKIVLVDEKNGILMSDFYKLQSIVANWD